MRCTHMPATAEVPPSAHVASARVAPAAMLCQCSRSENEGGTQQAESNQNYFEDGTTKDKARHIATLLAAAKFEAARIARIHYLQV